MDGYAGLSWFGLHKTTLIDFPKELAATLFVPGCNLRCPYCHNPELLDFNKETGGYYTWDQIKDFIRKRKNILGGICITGGEPLLNPGITHVVDFIHSMGLKVKLDTNGLFPQKLKTLKVEYIAMDIKTTPAKYHLLGAKYDAAPMLAESIDYIIDSGIPYEFRTTVVPDIITIPDIMALAKLLKGAQHYILSPFRPENALDPVYKEKNPYPIQILDEMQMIMIKAGVPCRIRNREHFMKNTVLAK